MLQESVCTFWTDRPGAGRTISFGSSSVQHGAAVFEGIRCYVTPAGPALFRLDDHLRRLLTSARLLGLRHGYHARQLRAAVLRAASGLAGCYLRPGLFSPDPLLTVDLTKLSFRLGIEVWPMPGEPSVTQPIRLAVSPWRRPSPRSFPARAKAVGSYVNSALAKTAAVAAGFDDAIQLDPDSGRVAEATTTNIFLARDGVLTTPWLTDSLLAGITRDAVLALARRLGIPTEEGPVALTDLWAADEIFLTGTAGELIPVASVDQYSCPRQRPLFDTVSAAFRSTVTGHGPGPADWLTGVAPPDHEPSMKASRMDSR